MTALTIVVLLVTLINSVVLAAVVHQLGLLSLRVRPVPAMEFEDGPQPGDKLRLAGAPWATLGEHENRPAAGYLLVLFSPTCSLCGQIIMGMRSIANQYRNVAPILVTEAPEDEARQYLKRRNLDNLSLLVDERVLRRNGIPGVPFAIAVAGDGTIVKGGGINTVEQVEDLIDVMVRTGESPVESSVEPEVYRIGMKP